MTPYKPNFPELFTWQAENAPGRFVVIVVHPGHGACGVRLRLFEVVRDDDDDLAAQVTHSVTEDGPVGDLPATVARALARWGQGEYDTVTVPTLRSLIGDGP